MALDLKKLNEEQREAVLHKNGPLLIVAGAGTGKTTVITQRIANLIEEKMAKPEEILALTFTEKAAFEMEERVDRLLDIGYVDLWISTFHSFCEKVLRENALDIGLSPDFKILDPTAAWLLARKNLEKFELKYYQVLGNPTKFIQALVSHFSHAKDQDIRPENYLSYADDLKTTDNGKEDNETERIKEVANAYHAYQQILLQNNCLDFGDLISYCLNLFKKRPLILKKYREKFKYILVDEFQDTNWSQYELVKLLAEPKNNLCVCADDDQAIYRWRGASFSNIVQFSKDFSAAKNVSLIKNYRSGQEILDKAHEFIKQNNPDRLEFINKINKKLVAGVPSAGFIEHIHAKSINEETAIVVRKILEILEADKDANYNDFAILCRANDSAGPFIRAFERANLPYQFLASRGLYSKPVILDVISYFKLLDNYHEGGAAYRILCLPFFAVPECDIATISQYARRRTKSLFEAMQESSLIYGLEEKTREKIVFILELIKKHSALAREKGAAEIFVSFLEDSGYLKYLLSNNQAEKIDLLNQFYKKIKQFEESNAEPALKNFMEQISLELEAGEDGKLEFDPDIGPEMIKVMTIHGAKGLEFKYVFVVSMVGRRFPTDQRKDPIELPEELIKDIKPTGDIHLQEERRLCYVAMTRAKTGLYFTSASDYGGQRAKKISRFLSEMGYKEPKQEKSVSLDGKIFSGDKVAKPPVHGKQIVPSIFLPEHFSYSQLAAFEKCPLQYKYAFILKIPVRGKAVFSFGQTIHKTLYDFLKQINEPPAEQVLQVQEALFESGPTALKTKKPKKNILADLLKIYESNWIDEWYDSKSNKEKYFKKGKEILKDFYKNNFEGPKGPPKIFQINDCPALEVPFNLKIGGNTIIGKIDRIDETDGGDAEIIDYKTGASKDKPEKEQLLIYQIASEEVLGLNPKKLSYFYVEDGREFSFLGSPKEIGELKEKIAGQIGKIKNSQFEPTPGWQCQFCDFKDICDHAER